MPFRLEAHEQPLLKIFSADFDFSIPLYQRPYAWTVEEAGTLLTDLLDNMGTDGSSVDETNPYFLGSIVLVKGDTPPSEVVDGQQRLATLTILLSILRPFVGADSQAQNFDFDVKKQKYFTAAKGVSNFTLTTQVLTEKEWTPDVVERRQKEALSHLKRVWRLS